MKGRKGGRERERQRELLADNDNYWKIHILIDVHSELSDVWY